MQDDEIDPALFALLISSQAASHIVDLLPETDLCIDLKEIVTTQEAILAHIIHDDFIKETDLSDFIVQCDKIIEKIITINQKNTYTLTTIGFCAIIYTQPM